MNGGILCMPCDSSFPTLEALLEHESSGHTIPGKPTNNTPPPKMDSQFAETLKQLREDKEKKQREAPKTPPVTPPPAIAVPGEIKLTYQYTGHCSCGNNPTTLMIDNEAGYFAIAYCVQEAKQLQSQKVAKLDNGDKIEAVKKGKQ